MPRPQRVTKLATRPTRIKPDKQGHLRLRIGIGTEEGFIKLGPEWDQPDYVLDTKAFPWPVDDATVEAVFAAFYFHRLTQDERFTFMNECGRVLKVGGQLMMVMPHGNSMRVAGDPWAQWPPVMENSFFFYNKAWREKEKAEMLPITCDFGDVYGVGWTMDPDMNGRSDEYLANARKHWNNAIMDLHITLTRQS